MSGNHSDPDTLTPDLVLFLSCFILFVGGAFLAGVFMFFGPFW